MNHSRTILIIAFILVLIGAVLPFLMVIKLVTSSFLLNFIAYGTSIGGLFLGVIGAAQYVGTHRNQSEHHEHYQ